MIVMLKLTKHHGANTAGETAGFSPHTADWILQNKGGEKVAEFDETKARFDPATGKVVPLKAAA